MYSGYFGTVRLAKLRREKPKGKKKAKKKRRKKKVTQKIGMSRVYICVCSFIYEEVKRRRRKVTQGSRVKHFSSKVKTH